MSRRSSSCPIIDPSVTLLFLPLTRVRVLMHNARCTALRAPPRRARRSAHAGLLLCFMSPEVEAAFPEQAQALYAGFKEPYQHPATVDDVCRYPPVGRNACNEEEVRWFEAT